MKKSIILYLLIVFVFTIKSSNAQTEVTFYTSMGDFTAETYDTLQPITAGNFLSLVNSEFYDGIIFHRVMDGFMIQGGDPTGTGSGGSGYPIDDEFDPLTSNMQGALAMANSGPNTGESQFFINLVNNTYLDPNYPVFGMVTSNFNIVQNIGAVSVDANDRPYTDVIMDSIRVTNNPPLWMAKENTQSININIFPNPTNGNITIDIENNAFSNKEYTIKIINMLNQVVHTSSLLKQQTNIDLSLNNSKGIYFIYIIDKQTNNIAVRKFVIQ